MTIIKFQILPLTSKDHESYLHQTSCKDKCTTDKHSCKIRKHCHYKSKYRGTERSISNLKFQKPKEKAVVFTMNQTAIIISSQKNYQKSLKKNLIVQEKMLKVTKTIEFQQKKKLQEFVKMGKKSQKPYLTNSIY